MALNRFFKNKMAVLWTLFIATLILRLYFSFKTNLTFDSYLALNEARSILSTGFPLHEHAIVFPPLFYYFIALFYKSDLLLNLFNSILYSSIIFLVYFLALHLSKDEDAALFSAAMAAFLPVLFSTSIGKITPYSLFIPLVFLFFLSFLKLKSERLVYIAIILAFTLPRTSLAAIFVVPTLMLYLILDKILGLHPQRKESELILLAIFVIPWATFIFFKKPFEIYGLAAIYGNVPERIMGTFFSTISIPQAIAAIGILPLLLGVFAIYLKIFNPDEKDRSAHMIISFVIIISLALWQRMIELEFALTLLGISLAVLAALSFKDLMNFIKKTKLSKEKDLIIASLIFLFILTLLFPAISHGYNVEKSLDKSSLISALEWIRQDVELDESLNIINSSEKTIISSPIEGYIIKYFTGVRPVLDESFLLVEKSNAIYEDIYKIYTTPFETDALLLLNRHNVRYIILDDTVRAEFSISDVKYANDKSCFQKVFPTNESSDNTTIVYKVGCFLR